MRQIKVKFVGFWPEFDANDNFIINSLRKKYDIVLSEEPEYLFSSCFSDDYLDYDCVRIFYTGENLCPDFNAFDYAIGFEHMEYGDRYLRYPNYMIPEIYGDDFIRMKEKHYNAEDTYKTKTEFCSFVVSKGDGYVAKAREQIFYELSKYRQVNSGGRFLNNIGEKDGVKDKLQFQSKHKFAIAFENSTHLGYSTEKLVQAFAAKTVPIYWGDPDITSIFNENAFINCHNFRCLDEVIQEVRRLDQDDAAYIAMLSQPALRNNDIDITTNIELDQFLQHIVGLDAEEAFRRDLIGYNQAHVDGLRAVRKLKESYVWKVLRIVGMV